jgi:oligoribonuclease NrnB/cAMP/cGMP phosphodiesterase (DHH superfamily)
LRLVTRSDFDGLVCAALLRQVEVIDDIIFVHPKDLQDGNFEVTADDILTNVPYLPGCGLWFDHHSTEVERVVGKFEFRGACYVAPSAARVVFEFYGGSERFHNMDELMTAVDKADSAQFTAEEILDPSGWPLLSFIMDARTGLGRFRDYRISNYQLMHNLIDAVTTQSIDEILASPDVQQRVTRYFEQDIVFREMLHEHTRTEGNVIITDLRNVYPIFCGNRFLVYALHPQQNISLWIVDGYRAQNCVVACGHSILNRSATTDVGELMRSYGGGGHHPAGTCQVPYFEADATIKSIIKTLRAEGRVAERIAA